MKDVFEYNVRSKIRKHILHIERPKSNILDLQERQGDTPP